MGEPGKVSKVIRRLDPGISSGPPRSRRWNGVGNARDLVELTPGRDKAGVGRESLQTIQVCHRRKGRGRKEDELGRASNCSAFGEELGKPNRATWCRHPETVIPSTTVPGHWPRATLQTQLEATSQLPSLGRFSLKGRPEQHDSMESLPQARKETAPSHVCQQIPMSTHGRSNTRKWRNPVDWRVYMDQCQI